MTSARTHLVVGAIILLGSAIMLVWNPFHAGLGETLFHGAILIPIIFFWWFAYRRLKRRDEVIAEVKALSAKYGRKGLPMDDIIHELQRDPPCREPNRQPDPNPIRPSPGPSNTP